jgi:membrane protein DedA with SNARE-associated domain
MNREKLNAAIDVVKGLLQWLVVSVLGFGYWMFVLLLLSLFLMNVWHTSFEKILRYGTILGVITSVVYAGILLRRKFR